MTSCCKPCDTQPRTALSIIPVSPGSSGHFFKVRLDYDYQPHESLSLLTFCVMVLRNGFTVTGESACDSPENFDPEIGRNIARENAVNKIWMLEGYLLKQRLSENNTVTCHNSPPMRGLFLRPRVVLADHVGLLAAGSGEI